MSLVFTPVEINLIFFKKHLIMKVGFNFQKKHAFLLRFFFSVEIIGDIEVILK